MYKYFISFNYTNSTGFGFGQMTVVVSEKIKANNCDECMSELVATLMKNPGVTGAAILNFQLLED